MEQIKELEEVLELLNTKQYTKLRQYLAELNDADIAGLLEELEEEEMLKVFRILPKDLAADVFSYLDMDNQQKIITSLSDKEATNIINNLMADDAADLLEEMPANIVKKLLTNASPDVRRDINHLLRYPEDSAGSIMTVEYVDLKENLTVNQAIERIRKVGLDSETINICYVLDAQRRLVGTVALRYLLLMDGDEIIGDIMHENVISINTLMDQEEVARQFKKYDFTAMPVVDNENRLVGIITVDDIVDIIEEETTEDMEKMAAIVPSDKPYMKTGVFETFKKRIPWLLLLMVSATFTGAIISSFEDALSVCAVLVAYIPMLMDTGGNCGSQASVTVIRGISLDEIEFSDLLRVIWKEIRVAVLCAAVLSAANFVKLLLVDKMIFGNPITMTVAAVICLTLIVTVFAAKLVGCTLPLLAKKPGCDAAILDVMLPGMNGFSLCETIRRTDQKIGIIILSAKGQEQDKIRGLSIGADDYMTKPFSVSELLARVEALCRRVHRAESEEEQDPAKELGTLTSGDFVLDENRRVLLKAGQPIELTQVEFQIMELFFRNPGIALVREKILKGVWGENYFGDVKIVDVNIRRLRMKVEDEPSHPTHIMTVWGYGYRWEE